jgi:alkylation response protein AidB-like acyl-CoA dehydrogenase
MPYVAREGHTAPTSAEQEQALRTWYRTLYAEGLIGASWPEEFGGDPDHQLIHQLIVTEELIRARAPRPIDQIKLASHVLLAFGTHNQKARYLARIRAGEDVWCQLFSEPDAGSDLAGIRARAQRGDDGSWALSGQKTWTTDGHWAQMGIALLSTSSEAKRHAGITAFLVPMDAPGLETRPKRTIGGAFEFNDVFLDGVVLPADSVLGAVGEGWAVAMSGLEAERLGIGGNVLLLDMLLDDVVALVDALRRASILAVPHAEIEHRISELATDAQLAKAFVADHVDRALVDQEVAGDGSISKILYTEAYNRIARFGAELASGHAPLPDAAGAAAQRLVDSWLWSRSLTISGGSNEVMRNIIAKRRLRLPQE